MGLRRPETYKDVFQVLNEGNILDKEMTDKLSEFAGFRNIAIHIYWRVNFDEVYEILKEEVKVIKSFIKKVEKLI